jgi:hypothetical protein
MSTKANKGRKRLIRIAAWIVGAVAGTYAAQYYTDSRWSQAAGPESPAPTTAPATQPVVQVTGGTPVDRGRYIIQIAGCHTPGFMETGGDVPESEWLTGVPVGWRGPWGTTYAANLRLAVSRFDEDVWVQVIRARKVRPPMPWSTLAAMSDDDLRAVYRYIRSLPVKGEDVPAALPPGQEPETPYLMLEPVFPKK